MILDMIYHACILYHLRAEINTVDSRGTRPCLFIVKSESRWWLNSKLTSLFYKLKVIQYTNQPVSTADMIVDVMYHLYYIIISDKKGYLQV